MKRFIFKLTMATVLALPVWAGATEFTYNRAGGDVCAGFRKTGAYADPYEAVANFGNFTNFLNVTPGSTITMTKVSPSQLKDCFADGNSNLQWSAWGYLVNSQSTSYGAFPNYTIFFTLPNGTNLSTQTVAPARDTDNDQGSTGASMIGCENGAYFISSYLVTSNQDNTPFFVRESVSLYGNEILSAFISDSLTPSIGDFGDGYGGFGFDIENVTPNTFNAAQRSDLYFSVPASQDDVVGDGITYIDPLTHLTNGLADFIGYFTFYPSGTMTFTRAFGFTSTATNGTAPLQVVFTTTATSASGATNWVWNFGNGTIITNITAANVTNTYTAAGTYTVTLTINGPNGPEAVAMPAYVVVSGSVVSIPAFSSFRLSSGELTLSGTNGSAGAQYRILESTDSVSGQWNAVFTNQFSSSGTFGYTNSLPSGIGAAFFKLISP